MRRQNLILLIMLCAQFAMATTYSLFTDKRGHRPGDIVTVLVVESASASNDASTKTESENDLDVGISKGSGALKWVPGIGLSGSTGADFTGKGATSRNGELKATVTAKIMQVLDNGNLMIEGSKMVTVNNEEEVLEVSGIIRADDINPDNTIYSSKLADAVIRYSGNGVNSSAQEPGVLTRFLNWLF
ncbi:MAG TPA: flagellar basal body L-ring protein FlgH [Fibrobacteraceae bacterium]|nr:flagellar basal body L-ring protein FlgH [Fibrobacteraceae bacterium]